MSSTLSSAELENLGAIFVGFVTTTVLYGLTFFQTYIYYTRYPRDSRWFKYLVIALCILDTAASALTCEVLYYYLIILFDVSLEVFYASVTFCIQYMLSVILTFISSLFFAFRVYQVTERCRSVTVVLIFLSFIALIFGLTASVQMIVQRRLSAFGLLHMEIPAAISLVTGVVVDVVVFATLSFSLRRARYPNLEMPHGILPVIAAVFIGRGLLFTLAQVAYAVVFLAAPSRQLWVPFQMVASKFYVNTLLAQLNSRRMWQGRGLYEEDSLGVRKGPTNGRLSTTIRFHTNSKATTPSVNFDTSRPRDTQSIVTELDSKRAYGELGNEYTQVSTASSQSQTDEAIKTNLSIE